MVRAHSTKSIELSSERADTENLGECCGALSGVQSTWRDHVILAEIFIGQPLYSRTWNNSDIKKFCGSGCILVLFSYLFRWLLHLTCRVRSQNDQAKGPQERALSRPVFLFLGAICNWVEQRKRIWIHDHPDNWIHIWHFGCESESS